MSTSPRARKSLLALAGAGLAALIGLAIYYGVLVGGFSNTNQAASGGGRPTTEQTPGPWLLDFAKAKEKAAREHKDILLSFEGSDWCIWCQRMEQEILAVPEFLEKAGARFVLVKVDFPRQEPALSKVPDPAANQRLQQQFGVTGFPAIVVTDAQGDVLGGFNGFLDGGPGPLLANLDRLQQMRAERDQVIGQVEKQEAVAKLVAAKKAQEFLIQRNLISTLKRHVPAWLELAKTLDPRNEQGYLETFFEFDWFYRFQAAPTEQLPDLVSEMTEWRKKYGDFKDKERAAFLWLELARAKSELEDFAGAFQCLDEGLKLEPKDPRTRQQLQNGALSLGLGTGTAFSVSDQGHFLTNAHVVTGPGKVFLQLAGKRDLLPSQLVAERLDLDLALVKIEAPEKSAIAALPVAAKHEPRRGEEVATWGYPLGTSYGHGLKLTKGVISGLPERGTGNMLLLDLRINPGSSGSPLCDAKGNVVGVVSARSQGFPGDAYGMAVPVKEVIGFLKGVGIEPLAKVEEKMLTWDEIDQRISRSVAMVIKARPLPQKAQ